MITRSLPPALVLAACALCMTGGTARAQSPVAAGSGFGSPASPVVGGKPHGQTTRQELPPALPGARSEKGEAAPAQRSATDLQPTEALFDGINRGDVGSVRDALNRGADIDARNVLGLTSTELSVDLGRNDITFLLLSQRGAASGADDHRTAAPQVAHAPGRAGAHGAASADAAPLASPSARNRAGRDLAVRESPVREASTREVVPPRAVPSAPTAARAPTRQYASDGGTPIPQMGFLGFGGVSR